MTRRLTLVPLLAACALLSLVPAAGAAAYRSFGLNSAAPVPGVSGSKTFLEARVILPASWKRISAPAGALRFREGHRGCFYVVSFGLRAHVAPTGTPAEHVAADLPVAGRRFLLDDGLRPPGAWRVTRVQRAAGRVSLRGAYARVAHADAGLIPSGQAVWAEIVANATSEAGGECHSGSYRSTLGPALGDAFATTRTRAYARRR